MSVRETNESEPIDDASLRYSSVVETRGAIVLLGRVRGKPDDCADGDRRRGGAKLDAGFCAELQEPVVLMQREKHKRREPRGERTDAEALGRTDL